MLAIAQTEETVCLGNTSTGKNSVLARYSANPKVVVAIKPIESQALPVKMAGIVAIIISAKTAVPSFRVVETSRPRRSKQPVSSPLEEFPRTAEKKRFPDNSMEGARHRAPEHTACITADTYSGFDRKAGQAVGDGISEYESGHNGALSCHCFCCFSNQA